MKKILYVEDEPDQIAMLQTRLEALGYSFLSAMDGKSGLDLAVRENPDLILLDIIMPELNGYEFCQHLKKEGIMSDIPIIVVTASGAKELEKKCIEIGVKEIMRKPFDSNYLVERIRHYIENAG